MVTPVDTSSPPILDLHMWYLLRPILFPNLSLFSGLHVGTSNIPQHFLDFPLSYECARFPLLFCLNLELMMTWNCLYDNFRNITNLFSLVIFVLILHEARITYNWFWLKVILRKSTLYYGQTKWYALTDHTNRQLIYHLLIYCLISVPGNT